MMTITDYIDDYLTIPADALDWKLLGKTTGTEVDGKGSDGYDYTYTKPTFPTELQDFDGKTVKVKGFIFPLEGEENQKLFLIGPFPLSCPYHYHVGPSLIIEAHADRNPVAFTYDPVTITGQLELVADDPDYSTFYRLHNVHEVKE